ncbi:MAG: hypothetical protein M3T56_06175 [Chloroflexota bacterium]|nr:hypothetical protein [Chloroflexota bacterium]
MIALGAFGCIGDASHVVEYHNSTTQALNVYADNPAKASNARLVAPGATLKDQWIVPATRGGTLSGPARQIEARTQGGQRIFCHLYTYEELERASWVIEVVQHDDCSN